MEAAISLLQVDKNKYLSSTTNSNTNSSPAKYYVNLNIILKWIQNLVLEDNRNLWGIYDWTNLKNNKKYIGSSISLSKKFVKYFNLNDLAKNNMLINADILKYGLENFKLEIF